MDLVFFDLLNLKKGLNKKKPPNCLGGKITMISAFNHRKVNKSNLKDKNKICLCNQLQLFFLSTI